MDFASDLKAVCDETAGLIIITPLSADDVPVIVSHEKILLTHYLLMETWFTVEKSGSIIRCWEMFDSLTNSLETFADWPYYYILLRDGKDLGSLICFHPINCWFSQRDDSPLWLLLGSKKNPKASELLSVSHLISGKKTHEFQWWGYNYDLYRIYIYVYIYVWIDIIQHMYIYNIL